MTSSSSGARTPLAARCDLPFAIARRDAARPSGHRPTHDEPLDVVDDARLEAQIRVRRRAAIVGCSVVWPVEGDRAMRVLGSFYSGRPSAGGRRQSWSASLSLETVGWIATPARSVIRPALAVHRADTSCQDTRNARTCRFRAVLCSSERSACVTSGRSCPPRPQRPAAVRRTRRRRARRGDPCRLHRSQSP